MFQYFWRKEPGMSIQMRAFCAIAPVVAIIATTGNSEERRNADGYRKGPPLGCYARVWTETELAGSPQQVIKAMRAKSHTYKGGPIQSDHYLTVDVILADQGLARAEGMGGARLISELSCAEGYRREFPFCYSYCGGNRMVFPRLEDADMVFQIDEFKIVDGAACSGASMDLAGGRKAKVAYRLDRVPMSECEGL